MKNEVRRVCRDRDLGLEACRFQGIMQPFPNHFHDHYVIGLVEAGSRSMICKNREYTISAGDMVLFRPGDNHGCVQCDGGTLDYRALNIPEETMGIWTKNRNVPPSAGRAARILHRWGLCSGQPGVHGIGAVSALHHGLDYQGLACAAVAAGEHLRYVGLVAGGVQIAPGRGCNAEGWRKRKAWNGK